MVRDFISWAAVALFAAAASPTVAAQRTTPVPTFSLSDVHFEDVDGARVIVGRATNSGDTTIAAVHVRFTLLDAQGHPLGVAFANGGPLGPHQSWQISGTAARAGATKFVIENVDVEP